MKSNTSYPFVDTDVIIRFLTGDDLQKQKAAAALFEKVESGIVTLQTTVTAIADVVYVLSSPRLYNVLRQEIRDLLSTLVGLPCFRVPAKQALLQALSLYAEKNLDFGDAFLICSIKQTKGKTIYSYDRDFDKIGGLVREEPKV